MKKLTITDKGRNSILWLFIGLLIGCFIMWVIYPKIYPCHDGNTQTKSTSLSYEQGYQAGVISGTDVNQELKDSLLMATYKLRLCLGLEKMPFTPAGTVVSTPRKSSGTKTSTPKYDDNAARPAVKTTAVFAPPPMAMANKTEYSSTPTRINSGNLEGGLMSVDRYGPAYTGDFCTTVQNGFLIYALSDIYWQKSKKTITEPLVDGQKMSLDSSIGYWILISGIKLTPEVIINERFRWSVYEGIFQGSGFSYEMFLPHESVKPIMRSVRGREDGQVTDSEMSLMGQQDENISRGLIGPNLNSVVGSDSKTYFGWEFITPVNYVEKTT